MLLLAGIRAGSRRVGGLAMRRAAEAKRGSTEQAKPVKV